MTSVVRRFSKPRQFQADSFRLTTYVAHPEKKTFKTSDMRTMQAQALPSAWYNHDDECPRFRLVAIQWEDGTVQVAKIDESLPMKTRHGDYDVWSLSGPSGPGTIKVGQQCRGTFRHNQVYRWDTSNPRHYVKRVAVSVTLGPLCAQEAFDADVWAAWQKRWQS